MNQKTISSVLAPTIKQINEALDKLVKDGFIIMVQKNGVKNYMRNKKSAPFESPYESDDSEDDENEEDDDDEDADDNDSDDGEADTGAGTVDVEPVDEINSSKDGNDKIQARQDGNLDDSGDTDTNHESQGETGSAPVKKRQRKSTKTVTGAKKPKKAKETNPLKRKINSELLQSLAVSGVFIMEGKVVLKEKALEASQKIEMGLWHTSMQPRKQGTQQSIQGGFQRQAAIIIEGDTEHFREDNIGK